MQILKNRKNLLFLFVLVCLIAGIFLLYRNSSPPVPKGQAVVPDQMRSAERMKVRGFRYYGTSEGRKVLAISADKFTVEKKKIAFFRSGISNDVRLRNACIDIYGAQEAVKEASGATRVVSQRDLAFPNVFSQESWPSLSSKRISSIRAEPVTVKIHDGESVVTEIHADAAVVRPQKRDFLFEGHVQVKSGGRELKTERLAFIPDGSLMKTDEACEMTVDGKAIKKSGLVTDIFLR